MEAEMFKILKMYRDTEDTEMGSVDGKAFETLSKAGCIELMKKYGVNGKNFVEWEI